MLVAAQKKPAFTARTFDQVSSAISFRFLSHIIIYAIIFVSICIQSMHLTVISAYIYSAPTIVSTERQKLKSGRILK